MAESLKQFLGKEAVPIFGWTQGVPVEEQAMQQLKNIASLREHGEAGDHAASASSSTCISGYQRLNTSPNSPFRVFTRVCNSRCAPRFVHCICCFPSWNEFHHGR